MISTDALPSILYTPSVYAGKQQPIRYRGDKRNEIFGEKKQINEGIKKGT